jgi:hypothetical protein
MMTTEAIKALVDRIQNYLGNGGFFNPELMDHEKVRTLIMDIRDAHKPIAEGTIMAVPRPIKHDDKVVLVKLKYKCLNMEDGEFLVLTKWPNGNWHSSAGNVYVVGEDFNNLVWPLPPAASPAPFKLEIDGTSQDFYDCEGSDAPAPSDESVAEETHVVVPRRLTEEICNKLRAVLPELFDTSDDTLQEIYTDILAAAIPAAAPAPSDSVKKPLKLHFDNDYLLKKIDEDGDYECGAGIAPSGEGAVERVIKSLDPAPNSVHWLGDIDMEKNGATMYFQTEAQCIEFIEAVSALAALKEGE